jgi:hypothetical protein
MMFQWKSDCNISNKMKALKKASIPIFYYLSGNVVKKVFDWQKKQSHPIFIQVLILQSF